MAVREVILRSLAETLQEHAGTKFGGDITDDTEIVELRLDSIEFAALLARLEQVLEYDPFTMMDEMAYPTTFGELVRIYEEFSPNVSHHLA